MAMLAEPTGVSYIIDNHPADGGFTALGVNQMVPSSESLQSIHMFVLCYCIDLILSQIAKL